MQVAVLKEEGLTRELEVTIPASLIQERMEMELVAYGQRVRVDGFRKGKIPMPIMKKNYGKMVLGEVIDKTIQESAANAMKEKRFALQCSRKSK